MNLRGNALLLALLTALVAILGDWSGSPWLAVLWRLPAGLLLLGLGYESWLMTRAPLRLELGAPAAWILGRPVRLQLRCAHPLRRSLRVEIAPAAPPPFAFDPAPRALEIPAGQWAMSTLIVTPRSLGRYGWPALRVRVAGPFGLAWWSRRVSAPCEAQVVTDLLRNAEGVQGLGSIGNRGSATLGAGVELRQLRAYQRGDPPRIIDWKATARTRRLVSRDFSEDQHLEILILIDAGRSSGLRAGELDRFGHYVNVAARLSQFAVTQDDKVGLLLFAEQPLLTLPPARGVSAAARIRRALSGARVMGRESNPLQAALHARALLGQRSLVILLTDLDDATVASQLAGAVRLLLPKHLPFIAGLSSEAAWQLAQAPASSWLDPYHSLAAQEYCTGLERKVRALKSLGAPALAARPEQLEHAVFEAYASTRQRRRV
ncbi:MAG TPA: DUF58 domain-containing protein [Steroidobacteraceae bacterium]|nr:DUF58 domain-containing protein [Steroidobacteraceae bacterium]